jgi:polyphosphate kinase
MELPYINRELSWLEFNQRVLNEAKRQELPVLERLKFLSITASNLDEFFMVRVGGLEMLRAAGKRRPDPAGFSPSKQLALIRQRVNILLSEIEECFFDEILPKLNEEGIHRVSIDQLTAEQMDHVADLFSERVMPILTPVVADDNIRESGSLPSLCLALFCEIATSEGAESRYVVLPLPRHISRFVWLPDSNESKFILLEDIVANFAGQVFPDEVMKNSGLFRITRNADISLEEEGAHDLAREMSDVLAERKHSKCVRIDMGPGFPTGLSRTLKVFFGADNNQIYKTRVPFGLGDFIEVATVKGFESLQVEHWTPMLNKRWSPGENIFKSIAENDILLHHPYESFEPVIALIEQAATDPKVLAVKQTLYRTANNSRVISALIRAAENGKQVTVVVELKARFDEARNLERAEELEKAGVQIIYGVKGYKTHCKITLVVRSENKELKRYTHFGTGNYNEVTAGLYTDLSYMTSKRKYGDEAAALFNSLTGGTKLKGMKNIIVAPFHLREKLVELINAEKGNAEEGIEARIDIKVNNLQDAEIIKSLYRASQAGVKIRLNVRGICCLQPGIKKISKNIKVTSIVDRYLEHSRILSFHNGGKNKVFISSADLMERSFDRRVESMVEIKDSNSRKRILEILEGSFRDNSHSYKLESDGTYVLRKSKKGEKRFRAQSYFHGQSVKRAGKIALVKEASFAPHKPKKKMDEAI